MKIKNQRTIDRYAGSLICFVLSLVHKMHRFLRGSTAAAKPPRRILVILLSEMGSLVLAHPMFTSLGKSYPDAEIFLLQFKKNKELTLILDLVADDHVLTVDDSSFFRLVRDAFIAVWRLRRIGIDTVLDCELFSRISSIFSMLSGANVRVGFHPHTQEGLYRGSFINRPVLYNPYRHIARQFLTLAAAIDSAGMPLAKKSADDGVLSVPPVAVSQTEIHDLAKRLGALDGWQRDVSPDILIYPSGGILPIRAWPEKNYHVLCRRLIDDGHTLGVIGMQEDSDLARRVLEGCPRNRCVDLTGFTKSLHELIVLFHMAKLLITNDGGPGHFAVLTPIRALMFFGPETPVLYGPLGEDATTLFSHTACSPCLTAYNHRNSPCDGDNRCLKAIDVDGVHRLATDLLDSGRDMPKADINSVRSRDEG